MGMRKKRQQKVVKNQRLAVSRTERSPRFIIIFLVVFLLLFSVTTLLPDKATYGLSRLTAASSGLMLWAVGLPAVVHGRFLALDQFRVEIIPECTALYPVLLLAAFVLAYPASVRKKACGLLAGVVLLLAINALRIAGVVYVGSLSRMAFHVLHTYLSQVAMMLAVIGLCLSWARWTTIKPSLPQLPVAWTRLVLISATLFIGWLLIDKAYVAMNDALVEAWFSWHGRELTLQRHHLLYFETFNLPFFVSLVLATQRTTPSIMGKCLLPGALAIWFSHVLFRLGNAYLMLYGQDWIFLLSNSIVLLSQYLLTFVLWYALLLRQRDKIKSSAVTCRNSG